VLYWAGTTSWVQKNPGVFLLGFCAAVLSSIMLEEFLGVSDAVLAMLGRDRTLTDRTDLWDAILRAETNPMTGWGFNSFWETSAGHDVTQETRLRSAHNGYLEVFLDGGFVALGFLVLMLLGALIKCGREMMSGNRGIILKFALVVVAIVYNFAEAAFFRPSPIWFAFLFAALRPPRAGRAKPDAISTPSREAMPATAE
jgi:exopolysaccharide production protein ExoQ